MIYTVILHSHSYDLPAKTLAVTEKIEHAGSVDGMAGLSTREKYKIVLDCIIDLLGQDAVKEALGSAKLTEVDLSEVTLTFRKIVDAYNKPLEEYNANTNRAALDNLPIDQIVALADASKKVLDASGAMQSFGR